MTPASPAPKSAFDDPVKLGALKAILIAALERRRLREARESADRDGAA